MKEDEQEKRRPLLYCVWASEDFTREKKIENVLKFKY